jgi:hypothetical protein
MKVVHLAALILAGMWAAAMIWSTIRTGEDG